MRGAARARPLPPPDRSAPGRGRLACRSGAAPSRLQRRPVPEMREPAAARPQLPARASPAGAPEPRWRAALVSALGGLRGPAARWRRSWGAFLPRVLLPHPSLDHPPPTPSPISRLWGPTGSFSLKNKIGTFEESLSTATDHGPQFSPPIAPVPTPPPPCSELKLLLVTHLPQGSWFNCPSILAQFLSEMFWADVGL